MPKGIHSLLTADRLHAPTLQAVGAPHAAAEAAR